MKNSITDLLVLRSNSVARLVLPMQWARWRHPFTLYRTLFVPCTDITLYRTLFVPCTKITVYRQLFVPCTQTSHCTEHCSYPAHRNHNCMEHCCSYPAQTLNCTKHCSYPAHVPCIQTSHCTMNTFRTLQKDHTVPNTVRTLQNDHTVPNTVRTLQNDHTLPNTVRTLQNDHTVPNSVRTLHTDITLCRTLFVPYTKIVSGNWPTKIQNLLMHWARYRFSWSTARGARHKTFCIRHLDQFGPPTGPSCHGAPHGQSRVCYCHHATSNNATMCYVFCNRLKYQQKVSPSELKLTQ